MAPAAASKAVTSKKAAPVAKKVPPAKKEPAKKKVPIKKKAKKHESSDDESAGTHLSSDGSDSEVEVISAPVSVRERSGRVTKKVDYFIDDSDEDDESDADSN